jgi:hypothetical protein
VVVVDLYYGALGLPRADVIGVGEAEEYLRGNNSSAQGAA